MPSSSHHHTHSSATCDTVSQISTFPLPSLSLTVSQLVHPPNSATAIRRQLELFPSVEELGVSIKASVATLVNVLWPLRQQSSPPVLPNLPRIKLFYNHNMDHPIDYCPIIDLAHRRRGVPDTDITTAAAVLEFLHITIETKTKWDWYPNPTIRRALRRLIAGVLPFRILAPDGGAWPE
ncbi:hypothetical protein C8R45DRAFT_1174329 [Mycena sanguinolenta]|nr:hypothetical protein C8R45DRAFT_1174329 [Mycena sanguinolenta]